MPENIRRGSRIVSGSFPQFKYPNREDLLAWSLGTLIYNDYRITRTGDNEYQVGTALERFDCDGYYIIELAGKIKFMEEL